MKNTSSFRDLEVWQESMTLVEEIYALSKLRDWDSARRPTAA